MNCIRKSRARQAAAAGAAILMVLCMSPAQALAASSVTVDKEYTSAASGSGAEGGTWSWDGDDNMTLNNYSGNAISAKGDLEIDYSGENTLKENAANSILVEDGDLTLKGDGDSSLSTEGKIMNLGTDGDITIDGGTVNATATAHKENAAIESSGGNITIQNGATVTATGTESGIRTWMGNDMGNITIKDSTVTATGTSTSYSNGIDAGWWTWSVATSFDGAKIVIDNSTVKANGSNAGMFAAGTENSPGSITLINSSLAEGQYINNYTLKNIDVFGGMTRGQIITTTNADITTQSEFTASSAKNVVITAANPVTKSSSSDEATSKALGTPKTDDQSQPPYALGLFAALGFAAFEAFKSRKRLAASHADEGIYSNN